MATVLPKEINYQNPSSLPEGTQCNSIVSSPINGQTFGASSIIQFDLVQRGYMVPESMYLRYKNTYVGVGVIGNSFIRGTPVYTFISRLETIVGSQVVESIQNYNQLSNMLVNCKMNYAQKLGLANSFGYSSAAQGGAVFDISAILPNGQSLSNVAAAAPFSAFYAAPLGCLLSNCDRLVPLKYMPSCRIQLTTETIANAINNIGVGIASYTMANVELCYDVIEFSPLVDQAISSRGGGSLTIKSQSYLSSGVTLPALSSGTLEFLFNQRLASIKSLFCHLSGTLATTQLNTMFDSVDATANNGDYQFFIAGSPYPPRPLSTVQNKAGISMELSAAFGPAHDLLTSNFSITPVEFGYINAAPAVLISTTTQNLMGKFYIGVNCEKLSTNDALLTGVSSQGSPISFRVSLGTATVTAQVIQLICLYDALLNIDMTSRTVVVMQ